MKAFTYWRITFFTLILSCSIYSCSNHYNNTTADSNASAFSRMLNRAQKHKHYMIMHSGVDVYRIFQVEVEESKQQFTVHLNFVDSIHKANMNNPKSLGEKQTHVYMKDPASYTLDEPHTIPLNRVARIEVVD